MPRINLLPWREELRQKRKKDFLLALGGAILVAAFITIVSKMTVAQWIQNQSARNNALKAEIAELDRQIDEILGLENQKERLLARMDIIEQLQRSRPEVVHLFDELVDALPEGVFLTELVQAGTRIEISGTAQSSTRVSAFMRNIDTSEWLRDPGLDVVETVEVGATRNAEFTIFAQQVSLNDPEVR
ncbi:MAG: PilN domain-containing protein, partial [Pseudomonadota bacterium]|nr:PilN domain-containing protein [Pseudomonadota bacterium]